MSIFWQDIAVIGLHLKAPGADSPWHLCQNLIDKKVTTTNLFNHGNFKFSKGLLEDANGFDSDFFHISNAEANTLDPQHRKLLETAYHALEVAGIKANIKPLNGGVFAACSSSFEHWQALNQQQKNATLVDDYQKLLGHDKDFLATRIAYKLNLIGPALNIQSGCSSSLLALHYACRSLQLDECDFALACGVTIHLPTPPPQEKINGMIYSPSGVCKPFMDSADGTIDGEGSVCVVLKRLDDAIKNNDDIWTIIKGSAINNDGANKVSYSAPNLDSQKVVIQKALDTAAVSVNDIRYIEGHGTGTLLGDTIELTALNEVFSNRTKNCPLYIGSIKANIGHLDAASGLMGFAKACLMLCNNNLYPSPYEDKPNHLLINGPLQLLKQPMPISSNDYIGVSSFGVGGSNVHMILKAYSKPQKTTNTDTVFWFPMSSKSKLQLQKLLNSWLVFLSFCDNNALESLAKCQQSIVKSYPFRVSFITTNIDDLKHQIRNAEIITVESSGNCCNVQTNHTSVCHQHWLLGDNISAVAPPFWQKLPPNPFQETVIPWPQINATIDKNKQQNELAQSNTIETKVSMIWQQVLGIDHIDLEDNFFDLGGDSLMGVNLIQKINKTLSLSLSPVLIFDYPSLDSLCAYIGEQYNHSQDDSNEIASFETFSEL